MWTMGHKLPASIVEPKILPEALGAQRQASNTRSPRAPGDGTKRTKTEGKENQTAETVS